jgi:hypothetical protein
MAKTRCRRCDSPALHPFCSAQCRSAFVRDCRHGIFEMSQRIKKLTKVAEEAAKQPHGEFDFHYGRIRQRRVNGIYQ